MKKHLLIIVAALALASCTETYTITSTRNVDQVRTVQASDANVVVRPLTVDLQISSEGKITDTWEFTPSQTSAMGTIEGIRLRAAYLSQTKHKADIIIAPLYSVTINANGSSAVIVTGFPANYINWRPYQVSDEAYRAGNPQQPVVKQ